MFDAADSVLHLKLALEKIKVNIVKIITSRGFFHDVNVVLKVLELLKKTILSVEASNTTFADCFIVLIRLASTIKKIPVERGLVNFQNHVINSINKCWESFNVMPYILVYFLHPGYQGNGLKNMWTKISEYAQKLWENMGYNIDDQEILITQMLNFKAKQAEYNSRQNNDDIQKLIDESAFFEIENDNDDHEGEGGYEEYFEEVEIPKHNVYILIEEYVDLAILENDE
ncbi:unnamed protein product [Rhizophagus irregularis]|nr:unnamed protein product [Rhizophagus irregularis]CAB5383504.1 unnamed protein product [Rhizophagus irregularis]